MKMVCRRTLLILQKLYLNLFISIVWGTSWTRQFMAKSNAATLNISFAVLSLMRDARVIII